MPVWGEQDETIEGICCSSGNVQIRLALNKTGYVPGEPVIYTIDVFNKCDFNIEQVELELKQVGPRTEVRYASHVKVKHIQ